MTDEQIKHMVDRFLSWKLPEHFNPDCGIHFDADAAIKFNPRNRKYEPVGTNLFSATQADAMVRYMLESLPPNAETRPIEQRGSESTPPLAKSGIYIASKTKHADRWRFIRDKAGTPIISTWIDEAGEGESKDLHDLWRRCIAEASSCRVLVVYREDAEILKGGWVEVGAALAVGTPVFAVGLSGFTIANYHGVTHFASIKEAIAAAIKVDSTPPLTKDNHPERNDGLSAAQVETAVAMIKILANTPPEDWLLRSEIHKNIAEFKERA